MPIVTPQTLMFTDDGSIPNNPRLPLLLYRNGIDLAGTSRPEEVIEHAFAHHGWGEMWRNGIYPYVHYHSMIHEALGIARGRTRVSAARRAKRSTLGPAMSWCYRPAPVIKGCGRRQS